MKRIPFTVLVLATFLAAAPATLAQDARADQAALDFLKGLGGKIDERALGEDHLVILLAGRRIGAFDVAVTKGEAEGAECYHVTGSFSMKVPGGAFEASMEAWADLGPDLVPLASESKEAKREAGEEKTVVTTFHRTSAGLEVERVENGASKKWTLVRTEGLLEEGADFVLARLLAFANPPAGTKMTFLEHHDGQLYPETYEALGPKTVEIAAGKFETVGFLTTKAEYDDEAGKPKVDSAGQALIQKASQWLAPDGLVVSSEVEGAPFRIERKPAGDEPPETPVTPATEAVAKYFRAGAEGDAAALEALIDWDAIYETWSRGPGKGELAGKKPDEIEEIRKSFPGNFSGGLLGSIDEEARQGYRMLSDSSLWVEKDGEGGALTVQMVEEMRREDEGLAGLVFRVAQGKDGVWRIVKLPGLE